MNDLIEQMLANIVETDALPADTVLLISPCSCTHPITNHLSGHCDACPCERPGNRMVTKLRIDPP